jgi:hypothetical protein
MKPGVAPGPGQLRPIGLLGESPYRLCPVPDPVDEDAFDEDVYSSVQFVLQTGRVYVEGISHSVIQEQHRYDYTRADAQRFRAELADKERAWGARRAERAADLRMQSAADAGMQADIDSDLIRKRNILKAVKVYIDSTLGVLWRKSAAGRSIYIVARTTSATAYLRQQSYTRHTIELKFVGVDELRADVDDAQIKLCEILNEEK